MKKVKIIPTAGCYQKDLEAELIRETKTQWVVKVDDREWKFSKNDCLRVGYHKEEFPRYKIVL